MGQQHDFYLVQSGNLVPRAALWRGFLACFQQPSLLRPANLDSSDFHYTPTYSSWLNQIEVWFSILSRRALRGASFTSPRQLREAIDKFIQVYNRNATPFKWTKTNVTPRGLSDTYCNLCN